MLLKKGSWDYLSKIGIHINCQKLGSKLNISNAIQSSNKRYVVIEKGETYTCLKSVLIF